MFCKIRNAPLAKGYVAMARAIEGLQNSGPDLEQMISFVSPAPVFTIGSVFSYQSQFLDEDPNFSPLFPIDLQSYIDYHAGKLQNFHKLKPAAQKLRKLRIARHKNPPKVEVHHTPILREQTCRSQK